MRQEIPVKSFSIAAYVCRVVSGRGRYLVVRRSTPYLKGSWQMVSGRVEPGETGWEATLREIEEETGLVPDRLYPAELIEQFYEPAQNCVNLVPVFVGFVAPTGRCGSPRSTTRSSGSASKIPAATCSSSISAWRSGT